jgi:hypothetical protein
VLYPVELRDRSRPSSWRRIYISSGALGFQPAVVRFSLEMEPAVDQRAGPTAVDQDKVTSEEFK